MNIKSKYRDKYLEKKQGFVRFKRLSQYYYHRLFPRKHTSHSVALSIFLGIFIGLLPTLGFALILTFAACRIFKVPSMPGMLSSFIAIPPTLFFFFYPLGYTTGLFIINPPPIDFDFLAKINGLSLHNALELMNWLWNSASSHLLSFALGIFLVAFSFGILGYFISFFIMEKRMQSLGKLKQ